MVGVVSSHATTYADSLAAGRVVEAPVTTQLADGMACRVADAAALAICTAHRPHRAGQRRRGGRRHARLFTDTHNVAEGAGAASLRRGAAGARHRLAGQTVGVALTGGNVDADMFSQVLHPAP
jgi:threonine dehydratase